MRYYKRAAKNWTAFRWWLWWKVEHASQRIEQWLRPKE